MALFMFIPTNSDGQKLENLREKILKIKILKLSAPHALTAATSFCFDFVLHLFFFFFFRCGTHMSLYSFLVHLSPETNYFVPVSILFILIEYSLNICHFLEFF